MGWKDFPWITACPGVWSFPMYKPAGGSGNRAGSTFPGYGCLLCDSSKPFCLNHLSSSASFLVTSSLLTNTFGEIQVLLQKTASQDGAPPDISWFYKGRWTIADIRGHLYLRPCKICSQARTCYPSYLFVIGKSYLSKQLPNGFRAGVG